MYTFKKTVVGFVVVLTMLVSAKPADAQSSLWRYFGVCPPGNPLCQVMVGNQQMVRHMQSGYMGYIGSGGGFYGTHDPYGRPLPRLVKIAVGAGIGASLGGGVGDLFGHGREGSLIGAGIGALIGARHGSGNRNQPMVIDEGQQGVRIASDGTPVAFGRPVGTPPGVYQGYQPPPTSVGPKWNIRNMTGGKGDLYDGDRFLKVLESGETYGVSNPQGGFKFMILVPTEQGTLETVEAVRKPRRDGWDMVVPPVQ